jgi:hypothetical protein
MAKKGQDAQGRDQDDVVLRLTTVQKKLLSITYPVRQRFGCFSGSHLHRGTSDHRSVEAAPKLGPNQDNDFFVRNMTDVADAADQTNKIP